MTVNVAKTLKKKHWLHQTNAENQIFQSIHTLELQWLKRLWDYEFMFETGVVRANEC